VYRRNKIGSSTWSNWAFIDEFNIDPKDGAYCTHDYQYSFYLNEGDKVEWEVASYDDGDQRIYDCVTDDWIDPSTSEPLKRTPEMGPHDYCDLQFDYGIEPK
jgi:hypothetical protein